MEIAIAVLVSAVVGAFAGYRWGSRYKEDGWEYANELAGKLRKAEQELDDRK